MIDPEALLIRSVLPNPKGAQRRQHSSPQPADDYPTSLWLIFLVVSEHARADDWRYREGTRKSFRLMRRSVRVVGTGG